MAAATQNILNTPELKFPNPPDKFGQDGNFYRCYDTLAQEIDEDMTKGLKEHLDTMLVFVGYAILYSRGRLPFNPRSAM